MQLKKETKLSPRRYTHVCWYAVKESKQTISSTLHSVKLKAEMGIYTTLNFFAPIRGLEYADCISWWEVKSSLSKRIWLSFMAYRPL